VTKDGFLKKEAERILPKYKLGNKLKVMSPVEVMRKYF